MLLLPACGLHNIFLKNNDHGEYFKYVPSSKLGHLFFFPLLMYNLSEKEEIQKKKSIT